MNLYIAVTDNTWFNNLRYLKPDEVNFWVPGKTISLPRLHRGELLLFKLHSPHNFIVGGGVFAHSNIFPIGLAWQAFGINNGAGTERELRELIENYRGQEPPNSDYDIGCIVLTQPFFWEEDKWIPSQPYWKAGSRRYKKYDIFGGEIGKKLWGDVQSRLQQQPDIWSDVTRRDDEARYGTPVLVKPRLGQGGFRLIVTDAYMRRCAVTQERVLPALEAAHIKPYAKSGPHDLGNGILLRSDIHHLLETGYVTISPDYHFEVSKRIREEYENGRDYYAMHGRELYLPAKEVERPNLEFIKWHNENKFRG